MDIVADQQFWSDGTFRMVTSGNGEVRPVVGPSWRIEPDGAELTRGAPTLGQHDDYVYRELLGLEGAEYEALKASGAIS